MNVSKLMEILSDMPGDAIVTIGDVSDHDEAGTVSLLRIYTPDKEKDIVTTVNIDV